MFYYCSFKLITPFMLLYWYATLFLYCYVICYYATTSRPPGFHVGFNALSFAWRAWLDSKTALKSQVSGSNEIKAITSSQKYAPKTYLGLHSSCHSGDSLCRCGMIGSRPRLLPEALHHNFEKEEEASHSHHHTLSFTRHGAVKGRPGPGWSLFMCRATCCQGAQNLLSFHCAQEQINIWHEEGKQR